MAHLDAGLAKLRDAALRGELKIDSAIHIDPLTATRPEASVEALRRALFERHPDGQLPDILLEIDSSTHFSWLLLGREPHSRSELLMVYASCASAQPPSPCAQGPRCTGGIGCGDGRGCPAGSDRARLG
ncbi:hypothetical protein CO2235_MP80345 [Cupriavidus oxalaticus]|uniref:Uncharacterized protein n=1 Tax=Cupriavidus oxalaticus TaxID=96344 RepID=A0A375GPS6_9BURK|nr:hypothetical protein CO2235_MP80345 [Cupriavidus oxalaticus]